MNQKILICFIAFNFNSVYASVLGCRNVIFLVDVTCSSDIQNFVDQFVPATRIKYPNSQLGGVLYDYEITGTWQYPRNTTKVTFIGFARALDPFANTSSRNTKRAFEFLTTFYIDSNTKEPPHHALIVLLLCGPSDEIPVYLIQMYKNNGALLMGLGSSDSLRNELRAIASKNEYVYILRHDKSNYNDTINKIWKGICKPDWKLWSSWGNCMSIQPSCYIGTKQRTRACFYVTEYCSGNSTDNSSCTVPCNPPLHWQSITPWSRCSFTCKTYFQIRHRKCVSNNKKCPEPPEEQQVKACDRSLCKTDALGSFEATKELQNLNDGYETDPATAVAKYFKSLTDLSDRVDLDINNDTFEKHGRVELSVVRRSLDSIKKNKSIVTFNDGSLNHIDIKNSTSDVIIVSLNVPLPKKIQKYAIAYSINEESQQDIKYVPPENKSVLSLNVYESEKFQPVQAEVSFTIQTGSISSSVQDMSKKNQNFPVHDYTIVTSINHVCAFYDQKIKGFSTKGCVKQQTSEKNVTCFCGHTTVFAILLAIESITIPYELQIVSIVTETLSISSLILTIIILMDVKNSLQTDRIIIQVNLCFALLFLHFFNVLHDVAMANEGFCAALALLIHYTLLCSVSWMFLEGVSLLIKTTRHVMWFENKNTKYILIYNCVFGWGIPLFVVVISASHGFARDFYLDRTEGYGYLRCWVSNAGGILTNAVVIPTAILFTCNVLILLKVSYFIFKMSSKAEQYRPSELRCTTNMTHLVSTSKGVAVLMPVLGIPWIFSFLSGTESNKVSLLFMYLNASLNGLQGFFLLIVYCCINTGVRRACAKRLLKLLTPYRTTEASAFATVTATTTASGERSETSL